MSSFFLFLPFFSISSPRRKMGRTRIVRPRKWVFCSLPSPRRSFFFFFLLPLQSWQKIPQLIKTRDDHHFRQIEALDDEDEEDRSYGHDANAIASTSSAQSSPSRPHRKSKTSQPPPPPLSHATYELMNDDYGVVMGNSKGKAAMIGQGKCTCLAWDLQESVSNKITNKSSRPLKYLTPTLAFEIETASLMGVVFYLISQNIFSINVIHHWVSINLIHHWFSINLIHHWLLISYTLDLVLFVALIVSSSFHFSITITSPPFLSLFFCLSCFLLMYCCQLKKCK